MAPGVWRARVGRPEGLTLLGAAGAGPALEALSKLPGAPFPLDRREIEARRWGWKTAVRLPLGLDEEVYGLGVDFKTMRRTGSTFQLHVDHWGGVTGRTHAPVPLYVSTHGYAVLFNSARYLDVSVGLGVRLAAKDKPPVIDRTTGKGWAALPRSDSVEVLANAEGMEVYVFAGPTMSDAVRRYNLFNGWATDDKLWTHEEVKDDIRAAILLRMRLLPYLYDDDGETFDYERGEYSWTTLRVTKDERGGWQGSFTTDPRGKRWRYSDPSWTFMTK